MRIDRVVPNLLVTDLSRAVAEHTAVLGLEVLMDHGWIVTLGDEEGHQLSLMSHDASAAINPDVSVFVDDIGEALTRALRAGLEIVHPLTAEPWGVTRFFYRGCDGRIINVGTHTPLR
ncbi:VOC family protein [Nocardiopsis ansamitocini]|nr:VOC family protein [Nocardiopsis ansamitocini]